MKHALLAGMAVGVSVLCGATASLAQDDLNPVPPSLNDVTVPVHVDSGLVSVGADSRGPGVVFTTEISEPGAPWLRLRFDEVLLSGAGAEASYLVISSHLDGAVQFLRAEHVAQWRNSSAYFNGDTVTIDVVAFPGTGDNRLVMSRFTAGTGDGSFESICGNTDDRLPSDDPRVARILPVICSGWLIDDCNKCMITAGHCQGGTEVAEFNVPLSNAGGGIIHPQPEDQYAVDPASIQGNGGQGTGNDWAYFGCFPNPNTGLTPGQSQGEVFTLATVQPPVQGQDIRITGFGSTSNQVPPEWNFAQKTHTGPFVTSNGSLVQYQTDTTGGNSGSPVIDESTGEAIGVHTHGGCNGFGGNSGTGVSHAGWQAALTNPKGVCLPDGACDCVPDFNGDGNLDILDFVAFQDAFVAGDPAADIDGDGSLSILDFVAFQNAFNAGC